MARTLRSLLIVSVVVGLFVPVQAARAQPDYKDEGPNPGEFGLILGAGNLNSSPATERDGNNWILGWWTATDQRNTIRPFVGDDIGAPGILRLVKTLCQSRPSMALTNAIGMVYIRLQRQKK
jgi:hypothetical protein